jgi:hypothetical protein
MRLFLLRLVWCQLITTDAPACALCIRPIDFIARRSISLPARVCTLHHLDGPGANDLRALSDKRQPSTAQRLRETQTFLSNRKLAIDIIAFTAVSRAVLVLAPAICVPCHTTAIFNRSASTRIANFLIESHAGQ